MHTRNTILLSLVVILLLSTIAFSKVVYAVDFNITSTADFSAGVKTNTTDENDRYNQSANTLEMNAPYFEKDADLVNYWPFTHNASDYVGTDHGAVTGATFSITEHWDGAIDFTGGNHYVNMGDTTTLDGASGLTIVCWERIASDHNGMPYEKISTFNQYVRLGSDQLQGNGVYSGGGVQNIWGYVGYPSEWSMVMIMKNITHQNFYWNNSEVDSDPQTGTLPDTAGVLYFGARTGNSIWFDGYLAHCKFYKRNMTETERATLYNDGNQYIDTGWGLSGANWTSDNITLNTDKKLENMTITISGLDDYHNISKIDWSNSTGDIIASNTSNMNSTISLFFNDSYLTSGSFDHINKTADENFTTTIHFEGNGTSTPVISEIYGFYVDEPDITSPQINSSSNFSSYDGNVSESMTYYPNSNIGLQINFTDETQLEHVQLISNHTGTLVNYTKDTAPAITNTSNEMFSINITDEESEHFEYYWIANDTSGNENITDTFTFNINKATPVLTINNTTDIVNNSNMFRYLNFDGASLLDSSGNDRDATNNTATYSSNGKFGSCYNFIPNTMMYLYEGIYTDTGYTISMWINPDILTGTRRLYHEGREGGANDPQFSIALNSNGEIPIYITLNDGTALLGVTSTETITTGEWSHILWTDQDGTANLFINGVKDATDFDYVYNPGITLDTFGIGALVKIGQNSNHFDGQIDDMMFFERNFTEDEAKELYKTSQMYPYETNFTCTSDYNETTLSFYRNTTVVSNPDVETYGAENSYYTCNISATENYTQSSFLLPLEPTINSTTSSWMNLSIDSNETIIGSNANYTGATYQNVSNATGNWSADAFHTTGIYQQDITFTLYRNTTSIGTFNGVNDSIVLSAEYWNYTYYTAGNINYSAATLHYSATIDQNTTTSSWMNLTVNETEANLTKAYSSDSINVTANYSTTEFSNQDMSFEFYRNDTTNITLSGPNNESEIWGAGQEYYDYNTSGNVNYTSASKHFHINITQNTTTEDYLNLTLCSGTEANCSIAYPSTPNVTVWNDSIAFSNQDMSITLYRNYTELETGNTTDNTRMPSGYTFYTYNTSGNVNFSSAEKLYNVTVSQGYITTNFSLNGTQSNVSYNDTTVANLTAWTNATIDTLYTMIYTNYTGTQANITTLLEVPTNNTNTSILTPRRVYEIFANTSGSQNYSDSNITYYLTVNDTQGPNITVFTLSSSSITLGDSITISWNTTDDDNVSYVRISSGSEIVNTTYANNSTTYTPTSSGSETITLLVVDDTLNSASNTSTLTIATIEETDTTTSTLTSSRGFILHPMEEKVIIELIQDEPEAILFERDKESVIMSLALTVNEDILNAIINATLPKTLSDDIEEPKEIIYNYVKFNVENISTEVISKILIEFRVPEEWIKENDFEDENIIILSYENGEWNKLSTEISSKKYGYVYYTTTARSFTYFAIVGSKEVKVEILEQIPILTSIIKEMIENGDVTDYILWGFVAIILYLGYHVYKVEKELKIIRKNINSHIKKRKKQKK